MKLKQLAAFLMLLAIGCAEQPSSEIATPAPDSGGDTAVTESNEAALDTVEPETETLLASTTVSFDVTGMQ